jgi:hypothetical protein
VKLPDGTVGPDRLTALWTGERGGEEEEEEEEEERRGGGGRHERGVRGGEEGEGKCRKGSVESDSVAPDRRRCGQVMCDM